MNRFQLEHLIRAASTIAGDTELIIIGSQSIHATIEDAPPALSISAEADLYPRNRPERADDVDGAIGEGSQFHAEFGYYAQGVSPETAVLPEGWEGRLERLQNANTNGAIGYCISVLDLALSKYVANRPKDRDFIRELIWHRYVDVETLYRLVDRLPVDADRQAAIREAIRGDMTVLIRREQAERDAPDSGPAP